LWQKKGNFLLLIEIRMYNAIIEDEIVNNIEVREKNSYMKKIGNSCYKNKPVAVDQHESHLHRKQAEPSVAIKLQIENLPMRDQTLGNEVAIALEEMLREAEKGNSDYLLKKASEPKTVENKVTKDRDQEEADRIKHEEVRYQNLVKNPNPNPNR
jgi:hypothetical protein